MRVFDKFFRSEEQDIHRTGSGLGLGLAIAKGIVESQGGSIRIEEGENGFVTKFVVSLPKADRF
jgi:signal transduction histidine kinase